MLWIWGSKGYTVHLGKTEKKYCEVCEKERTFQFILQYTARNFWYVFGWVDDEKYLFLCEICNRGWQLDSKEVEKHLDKNPIPFERRHGCLVLILGIILFFAIVGLLEKCGGVKPESKTKKITYSKKESLPAQAESTEIWRTQGIGNVPDVEHGIGAAHRNDVLRAMNLIKNDNLEDAERLITITLNKFEDDIKTPGKLYVSLANRAELEDYKKEHPTEDVVWLDYAFGEALHSNTFLAVARRDFQAALQLSDREVRFRPYAAIAYVERGVILNQLGRSAEALEAYRMAAAMAERFSSSRHELSGALRGIGFTQVELGNFTSARTAIESSLKLEPGNELALREMEYIVRMEQERISGRMKETLKKDIDPRKACEKDCKRMFERGELKKGMTLEKCVSILCK